MGRSIPRAHPASVMVQGELSWLEAPSSAGQDRGDKSMSRWTERDCSEPRGSCWPGLNVVRTGRCFSTSKRGGREGKRGQIPACSARSHSSSKLPEIRGQIWQGDTCPGARSARPRLKLLDSGLVESGRFLLKLIRTASEVFLGETVTFAGSVF